MLPAPYGRSDDLLNALRRPGRSTRRLQVLINGDPWGNMPFQRDGAAVTDKLGTGPRRGLSLNVPDTKLWRRWLDLNAGGLQLVPWSGARLGSGTWNNLEVPLGRFTVANVAESLGGDALTLTCVDAWETAISGDDLARPTPAYENLPITTAAARLMDESLMPPAGHSTEVASERGELVPSGVWEGSRTNVIADLLESVGCIASVDRFGNGLIEDRAPATAPWAQVIYSGDGGTLVSADKSVDRASVVNAVVVTTTNREANFDYPVEVGITNPAHPAHRFARGGVNRKTLSSPLLVTSEQAYAAGLSALERLSVSARTLSIEQIPNPLLDAGDYVLVQWPDGTQETAQILDVTHPLDVGAKQRITTAQPTRDLT